MSDMQHFPEFSYVSGNIRIELSLDRYSKRIPLAQRRLGDMVLEDDKPYMPHLSGGLQQRSHTENGGRQVVFPGPYARFQYGGLVMVDPETGSPWARAGAVKVVTDQPLTYSSPEAVDHWFDTAKARHGEYWIAEVKRIVREGKL